MNDNEFLLDVSTPKKGIYLSQHQIDLLLITDLSTKEEVQWFFEKLCTQFPGKKLEEIIPGYETMDLDELKEKLFRVYQNSLVSYVDSTFMSKTQLASIKLDQLGVPKEIKSEVLAKVEENNIGEVNKILSEKVGTHAVVAFNRLMNSDFGNVKGTTYSEMKALNEKIKADGSIDTLIIATGDYSSSIFDDGKGSTYFDPMMSAKGILYAQRANKHVRYQGLFSLVHAEELHDEGKSFSDRLDILLSLKVFVQSTLEFISAHNDVMEDGTKRINTVTIFDELVIDDRTPGVSKPQYAMVWEKYFGISITDLMTCLDGVQKPVGVSYMYNEAGLEMNPERIVAVERVYASIMTKNPSLIDVFGSKMHLDHFHGMPKELNGTHGLENVSQGLDFMKKVQTGFTYVDDNGVVCEVLPKGIEITDFSMPFDRDTLRKKIVPALRDGVITDTKVAEMKHGLLKNISSLVREKDLKLDRVSYGVIDGKMDPNLNRVNAKIAHDNRANNNNENELNTLYGGIYNANINRPKLDRSNQVTNSNEPNIGGTSKKVEPNKSEPLKTPVRKDINNGAFDHRSPTEIAVANDIREKNNAIRETKAKEVGPNTNTQQQQLNNQKVLAMKPNKPGKNNTVVSSNRGSATIITVVGIFSLTIVAAMVIVYMLLV